MKTWNATDAEKAFGELLSAANDGPQMIMGHAEPIEVSLSIKRYNELKMQANAEFADFLIASPLQEPDFDKGVGIRL